MSSLPLSEAKAHLSEVVRRVRASGETVTVTVGGVPAVEIRPVPGRPAALSEGPVPEFWALLHLIQGQMASGRRVSRVGRENDE